MDIKEKDTRSVKHRKEKANHLQSTVHVKHLSNYTRGNTPKVLDEYDSYSSYLLKNYDFKELVARKLIEIYNLTSQQDVEVHHLLNPEDFKQIVPNDEYPIYYVYSAKLVVNSTSRLSSLSCSTNGAKARKSKDFEQRTKNPISTFKILPVKLDIFRCDSKEVSIANPSRESPIAKFYSNIRATDKKMQSRSEFSLSSSNFGSLLCLDTRRSSKKFGLTNLEKYRKKQRFSLDMKGMEGNENKENLHTAPSFFLFFVRKETSSPEGIGGNKALNAISASVRGEVENCLKVFVSAVKNELNKEAFSGDLEHPPTQQRSTKILRQEQSQGKSND